MTISLRRLSQLFVLRVRLRRPPALTACSTLALTAVLLASAAPAGAVVTTVESTTVGLQPRTEIIKDGKEASAQTFANNNGNAILDGTSVYAVYWDPTDVFFHDHHEWLVSLDGFFQQMGADSGDASTPFGPLGQYRDRANVAAAYKTVFKGSYTDSTPYPTAGCTDPAPLGTEAITCVTDAQLREQVQSFVTSHSLPKGMSTIYYIITPPGVTVCLDAAATHCSDYSVSESENKKEEHNSTSYKDSFCSYHGDINPDAAAEGDGNTILYAAIPWTAGTLGDEYELSRSRLYAQGYYCQDGGWNPEKGEENREISRTLTSEEEKAHEHDTEKQHDELVEELRLEGPHQEEPNQAGKSETGDYSSGLTDLIINQIAEEQANTVTDPLLDAWHDSEGNEVTDECRDFFASTAGSTGGEIGGLAKADKDTQAGTLFNTRIGQDTAYINNVFNLASGNCAGGVGLVARFTAPNPVNVSEPVGFDGMESTVSLLDGEDFGPSGPPTTTYATFRWNFGDGTEVSGFAPNSSPCEAPWLSPCAGSVLHSYQYGGVYKVTLTVTDVAGNVSVREHEVTVNGSASPKEATNTAGTSTSSSAATSTSSTSPTPGVVPPVPNPVAAAAVLSHSLRTTLRKGLVVRYSVNEQVAGHFDVLLSRTIAHRLGITGAAASGLPAGTAPQIVIAKAVLVTTKGGASAVDIEFSKRTQSRLAHLRSVTLLLRLIVRNAASGNPVTTTVLSSVTLSH